MYYTIEVIKAIWPVAIIMGLVAIPILTWIMHPKEKKTKDLLEHPTSSMNEPISSQKENETIK